MQPTKNMKWDAWATTMKCISFRYQGFSLSYFIAAPTCFIVSHGAFYCYFIHTLLWYFIISQPIFHFSNGTFYCYFIPTLLQYFIISQPIFHYFPWDISLLFHTYPAVIFHYFPAHFSLFPMGHFIAISYLPCCDISLFPSSFFIVSLGVDPPRPPLEW